jgi:hypothetical protein
MKSLIAFTCIFFSLSLSVFAQSPNAARAMKSTEKIAKAITLKEGQYEQINNAYLTFYRSLDNMTGRDKNGELINLMDERNLLLAEFDQNLASILDEQQLAEWKSKEAEIVKNTPSTDRREAMLEKINNSAAKKAERLASDLALTEEQQTLAYEAYLLHMTQIMELRTAENLDPSLKKENIDAVLEASLDTILTAEQHKKQEALIAERNAKREQIKLTRLDKNQSTGSDQIHQKAQAETRTMVSRLGLNPAQESQYLSTALTKFAALEKLAASEKTMDKETINSQKRKIQEDFDKMIKMILTPEQAEKLKARTE